MRPVGSSTRFCELRGRGSAAVPVALLTGEAEELRCKLTAAWVRGDDPGTVWRLIAADDWYKTRLDSVALSVCRRRNALHLLDDVKQEASLLMGRQVARLAATVKVEMLDKHFAGWFGTIVFNHCQEALRKLNRKAALWIDMPVEEMALPCREPDRTVAEGIEAMPPTIESHVLRLAHQGNEIAEIAETIGESYWKTRRLLKSAAGKLGRILEGKAA